MMTSAVRKPSKSRSLTGFTILEMVIVMAIVAVVVGGSLAVMYINRNEAKLNDAIDDIGILAKQARALASLQQRPYALEIAADGVRLMPYAEAIMESEVLLNIPDESFIETETGEEQSVPPLKSVYDEWVPKDSEEFLISVQRWSSTDWTEVEGRDFHVWRFDPGGAIEPLGVKIELVDGGSWISAFFHPLTATPRDIESDIR